MEKTTCQPGRYRVFGREISRRSRHWSPCCAAAGVDLEGGHCVDYPAVREMLPSTFLDAPMEKMTSLDVLRERLASKLHLLLLARLVL